MRSAETLKNAEMVLVYYSSGVTCSICAPKHLHTGINAKDTYNLRQSLTDINVRYFTRKSMWVDCIVGGDVTLISGHADMLLGAHNHPMVANLLAGGGSVLLTSPDVRIKV
jgi:hypothetical protein